MSDAAILAIARREGKYVLILDRDGAEFWVEEMRRHNSGRSIADAAVRDDADELARQLAIGDTG